MKIKVRNIFIYIFWLTNKNKIKFLNKNQKCIFWNQSLLLLAKEIDKLNGRVKSQKIKSLN